MYKLVKQSKKQHVRGTYSAENIESNVRNRVTNRLLKLGQLLIVNKVVRNFAVISPIVGPSKGLKNGIFRNRQRSNL